MFLALAVSAGFFVASYLAMPKNLSIAGSPKVSAFVAEAPSAELAQSKTKISLDELLNSANQERLAVRAQPLLAEGGLYISAQNKCADMAVNKYFGHYSSDGTSGLSYIESEHQSYKKIGENLAFGYNNATEVVAGWTQSPEHRKALLNPEYKYVGYGVCEATDEKGVRALAIVQHLLAPR